MGVGDGNAVGVELGVGEATGVGVADGVGETRDAAGVAEDQ